jgi:hypothetical protein
MAAGWNSSPSIFSTGCYRRMDAASKQRFLRCFAKREKLVSNLPSVIFATTAKINGLIGVPAPARQVAPRNTELSRQLGILSFNFLLFPNSVVEIDATGTTRSWREIRRPEGPGRVVFRATAGYRNACPRSLYLAAR